MLVQLREARYAQWKSGWFVSKRSWLVWIEVGVSSDERHGYKIIGGLTCLENQRVGDDFGRQKTFLVDQDASSLVKERGGEHNLLRLARVASSDPDRVQRRGTHGNAGGNSEDNDNDDCRLARHAARLRRQLKQDIVCSDGGTPMHARDGTGQQGGTEHPPPPGVLPGRLEDEEDGEGGGARGHGDEGGADNVGDAVGASVVADGGVSEVVHAADGAAGQRARDCDAPPADAVVVGDEDEGEEEHEDRDKHGGNG